MIVQRLLLGVFAVIALTAATNVDRWREMLTTGHDAEALAAVTAAAAQDDADALDFEGWFYDEGRGVAVDKVRAAALYRRAASAGQAHAQWRLAVMLDTADGVAADPTAAVMLLRKSAAQGFTNAYVSLGVMYSAGRGVERDHAKALEAYREAARRGNPHGFNEIGVAYASGEGVAQDRDEATAYFIISATSGDVIGKKYLQILAQGRGKADLDRIAERAAAIRKEFEASHTSGT